MEMSFVPLLKPLELIQLIQEIQLVGVVQVVGKVQSVALAGVVACLRMLGLVVIAQLAKPAALPLSHFSYISPGLGWLNTA